MDVIEELTQTTSSILDFLDTIGCKECGKNLTQKSMEIFKKKNRVYCPHCGKLNINEKLSY